VHRERLLKARVARYVGCLANLPAAQRELLELRTGLGVSQPLGPGAAAARLHLGLARFEARERQALRELSDAARSHKCSQGGGVLPAVAYSTRLGFGGGRRGGGATVDVAQARYVAPTKAAGHSSVLGSLLGTDIPPLASDVLLVLLLVLGMGAGVLIVMADAIGLGPRHEHWRQSVASRIRRRT
jgi:hypothetical protein